MVGDSLEKRLKKVERRFFVAPCRFSLKEGNLIADLPPDSVHHIRNVLRIGQGAKIYLFDGSGKEFEAEIILSKPKRIQVKVLKTSEPKRESALEIVLAQALLKENAFDRVLSSCTELGVKRIVPVITRRVVANLRRKDIEQKLYRWHKILCSSSAQSGRLVVPVIDYPKRFSDLIAEDFSYPKLILFERAVGGELERAKFEAPEKLLLLSGPEGGFEEEEIKEAKEKGFQLWGIGPRTLRAETASISAVALLQYLFGDLKEEFETKF